MSSYTKSIIHKSIIAPHFEYCSTLMLNYNQAQLKNLQKVQNRAMRIVLGVNKHTNIKTMLDVLGWMSIHQRVIYNTCILVFKMIHNLSPAYLSNRITTRSNVHHYNTRQSSYIDIKNTRTSSAENSILYKGIGFYK